MKAQVMEAMMKTITESFSSGYNGALEDAIIYKRSWEFELPDCLWRSFPEEGHVSLIYHHAEEILSAFSE